MTGTRFGLRRYSSCNLYARGPFRGYDPAFHKPPARERTLRERLARVRLYVTEEASSYNRGGRDKHGPWVWIHTSDCLYDWLANRVFVRVPWLAEPLYRLHEHVHEEHDHPLRRDYVTPVLRALVRVSRSRELDARLYTRAFPNAHAYRVAVRLPASRDHQTEDVILQLIFNEGLDGVTGDRSSHPRLGPTFTWIERASDEAQAREQAQARLRSLNLFGGSAWELPVKVTT